MVKKMLENIHRITFRNDPDAPRIASVIPDMSCGTARDHYNAFAQSGAMEPAFMLTMLQHLADDEAPHDPGCPYHVPGSFGRVQRYYHEFMGEGISPDQAEAPR